MKLHRILTLLENFEEKTKFDFLLFHSKKIFYFIEQFFFKFSIFKVNSKFC